MSEPNGSSKNSTLQIVDTHEPGLTRKKRGKGWIYLDENGKRVTDPETIARLDAIALPPAYKDTWYAKDPNGHIQATGVDAAGRKQYRYHTEYRIQQESRKFAACADFGRRLPRIRKRVQQDLDERAISAERAIASIVRLLDCGHVRVGSEAYAKENGSFGATTLRSRHAQIGQGRLSLRFKAKSGKWCSVTVSDRGLIRFVKQVQDLPGQHLFQYLDENGGRHPISSTMVNNYIRDTTEGEFTAKDFRTWAASVIAFEWLVEHPSGTLSQMLEYVAEHLANTPAVARKSYIHPSLVEHAKAADRFSLSLPRRSKHLGRAERGLIQFLEAEEDEPG